MKSSDQTINVSDCWNQIGVWRKGLDICPKLESVAHCRNCNVYVDAGLTLLDRDISEDYIKENTAKYKISKSLDSVAQVSCIIFRSENEWFAINTNVLNEICEVTEIHSIPHNRNPLISGIVNVRGEIEICLAFHESRQRRNQQDPNNKARMLVINLDSGRYVYRADEVMGIYKINNDAIRPTPSSVAATKSHYVYAMFDYNKHSIGLIDPTLMDTRLKEA